MWHIKDSNKLSVFSFLVTILVVHGISTSSSGGGGSSSETEEPKQFVSFADVESTIYYQSLCLFNEETMIKMQCPPDERIKILRTLYGFNPGYSIFRNKKIDSCTVGAKDCSFDQEYSVDNDCTGRNSCLVTIKKSRVLSESGKLFQLCRQFNYVQISYQCLPSPVTKDICGISHTSLSHAYILTPNLLNSSTNKTSCECTLISNLKSGQILLRRVDMKLPSDKKNHECTGSYLEVNEMNRGVEKKCGYVREPGSIYGSGANKLRLTFNSDDPTRPWDNSFWLEVLANPYSSKHKLEIICNPKDAIKLEKDAQENENMFKKLKDVIEKIKRLNNTSLLTDPKLLNFTNDAKILIKANAEKLINLTVDSNTTIANKMSKELIDRVNNLTLLDPLEMTNENGGKKSIKELVEIEKILAAKHSLNLTDLITVNNKVYFKTSLLANKNKLVTLEEYAKTKNDSQEKKQDKEFEKSWLNTLDSLEEELDLKEKLIKIETSSTTRDPYFYRSEETTTEKSHMGKVHASNLNLKDIVQAAAMPKAQKQASDATSSQKTSSAKLNNRRVAKRDTLNNMDDIKWLYFKGNKSVVLLTKSSITSSTKSGLVKAPAQWLEPFSFKFANAHDPKETSRPLKIHTTLSKSTTRNKESRSTLTTTIANKVTKTQSLLTTTGSQIKCERNLTRIAIYYSNKDELSCLAVNSTSYKCKDELLEAKFFKKLKKFYYVQLEPLTLSVEKLSCVPNRQKSTFDSIYLKQLDLLLVNNRSNLSLAEPQSLRANRSMNTRVKYVYDAEVPNNTTRYYTCNLITKSYNVRKRLVWRLYLMVKNESCVPEFSSHLATLPASLVLINDKKLPDIAQTTTMSSTKTVTDTKSNLTSSSDLNEPDYVEMSSMDGNVEVIHIGDEEKLYETTSTKPYAKSTTNPLQIDSPFSMAFLFSNKVFLIVLSGCSICFIIMANVSVYFFLKIRRKTSLVSDFPRTTSLNNRLLQNYLNLSFCSDNISLSDQNNANLTKNNTLKNKSKSSLTLVASEPHGDLVSSSIINEYAFDNQINSLLKETEDHRVKVEESGAISMLNFSQKQSSDLECPSEILEENEVHHTKSVKSSNMSSVTSHEINRIPSLRRLVYSVSSVATQADADNGTFFVERKDFKYRNQKDPDVESQIISIEIDLNSDVNENVNGRLTSNMPVLFTPNAQDKQQIAYVRVTDLAAFKNCLNFQLEAARAATSMVLKREIKSSSPSLFETLRPKKMILKVSARDFRRFQENSSSEEEAKLSSSRKQTSIVTKFVNYLNKSSQSQSTELSSSTQEDYKETSIHQNFYLANNTSPPHLPCKNPLMSLDNKNYVKHQDPNKIYNQVETSNGEESRNVSSKETLDEKPVHTEISIQKANSISNVSSSCSSKEIINNTQRQEICLNRNEKIRKMLEEEKMILDAARKSKSSIMKSTASRRESMNHNSLNSINKPKRLLFFSNKKSATIETTQKRKCHNYINSSFLFDLERRFKCSSMSKSIKFADETKPE